MVLPGSAHTTPDRGRPESRAHPTITSVLVLPVGSYPASADMSLPIAS